MFQIYRSHCREYSPLFWRGMTGDWNKKCKPRHTADIALGQPSSDSMNFCAKKEEILLGLLLKTEFWWRLGSEKSRGLEFQRSQSVLLVIKRVVNSLENITFIVHLCQGLSLSERKYYFFQHFYPIPNADMQ